ncbi:hypothetical protein VPH35_092024 [Triticum aestivum]|uniref:FBD domain-containing protein n=1 Tax=Triticum turgidum subsp. durum TaxID=4567 RepID=A0A9R0XFE4_TRITD|nr:unnamed protein product [Triticum turgidum subsp. durum]
MDDVAGSLSKNWRPDELEPQDPPMSRDGGSGDDNGNPDLISRLPEEILGSILSLLPTTKGAAQTSVLSSGWRHLWRTASAPLNLVIDQGPISQESKRITIVSKILAAHSGPARCLFFNQPGGICLRREFYAKFDSWFRSPSLNGLEELYLYGGDMLPCLLPSSALRFAPTLCFASIGHCDFALINDALVLSFPRLKQLKLYHVSISEVTLHHLLAGCTMLQSLDLRWVRGRSSIRIISPTVRSIGISVCDYYDEKLVFPELVIEDAPCLERLIPHGLRGGPRTIRVIAAPKLAVLGYLSRLISELVIGTVSVKEMIPIMFTTTVKVLVLQSVGPNLDAIVAVLRCFPCMEKLYIQSRPRKDMKNVQQYDTLVDPIECLDLHLRAIVVNMYQGLGPDVNFAKFFVLNAKVLKVMKFGVYGSNCNEQWIADQHRELQLDSRASGDARFDFVRYNGECTFSNMKHTHDMWIDDPFDSSLCKCCSPV